MARPALEIADIFRDYGPAWREANAGHVSLGQLKVMSAIESCRTAALGGHVMRCEDCLHTQIAYNSCRNRHCPKCQGSQALAWMKQRKSELLGVPYFHLVFTLPGRIGTIAYQNKAVVYDLLFKASSQTMLTIAADPKRLGVKIGITSVLHSWGSAMTHHPHVHMIVPGGGISLDGTRWIGCRPNYLLPVKVLSRLFRRLMLEMLLAAHHAGRLQFFGDHAPPRRQGRVQGLSRTAASHQVVRLYASGRSPGRSRVLAYLSRYTHRVRDLQQPPHRRRRDRSNVQLQRLPDRGTRPLQDHDAQAGRVHQAVPDPRPAMRIPPHQALRSASQWHQDRDHRAGASADCCGGTCANRAPAASLPIVPRQIDQATHPCPCCGGRMNIIETFKLFGSTPHHRPTGPIITVRIDTS